jgi:SAM-dependent methyltransferase
MERIRTLMHRYGEADFDKDYLRWGFHDTETQLKEAESILRIAGGERQLRILDLACGPGVHAIQWAKQGHMVTGVDLSETFITLARERAAPEGVSVEFIVSDIREFVCRESYDAVTWIETSFFDEVLIHRVRQWLKPGGCFLFDVRNPDNARTKSRQGNWRAWREENGIFYLERHETDERTGLHEDVWITIDPQRGIIEEKANTGIHPMSLGQKIQIMKKAGYDPVELRTMEGRLFSGGPEPYWLWLVGRR